MTLEEIQRIYDHLGFRIDDPVRWADGQRYRRALDDPDLAEELHHEAVQTVAKWRAENGL